MCLRTFKIICLEIYEHDLARFLTAPGLAWQGELKKTKVKLDLSTFIDVFNGTKRYQQRNMSCYSSICNI